MRGLSILWFHGGTLESLRNYELNSTHTRGQQSCKFFLDFLLKNWTCWEIKELFAFAYSSKIWPQELQKVTNFIVSKTLKLYDQKILPKDLSLPMVIKLWTFFEFKSSMWYAFKNKTRRPTNLNRIGCICISFQQIGWIDFVLVLLQLCWF